MSRIRLLIDIPVAKRHHLVAGRVIEVHDRKRHKQRGGPRWWVIGDDKEEVGILPHEAEEISDGVAE